MPNFHYKTNKIKTPWRFNENVKAFGLKHQGIFKKRLDEMQKTP